MIEVLVASTLLIVGVLATLALLDNGARATGTSLQRDTGNSIAREVVERTQGMAYTTLVNDLTDVRSTAPRTPSERLRAAMDPAPAADGSTSSAPVVEGSDPGVPIVGATDPWRTTASWKLRRRGTDYTVTYRACTRSEPSDGVLIMGPYDCDRAPSTTPPVGPVKTEKNCALTITNDVKAQVAADPSGIVARVQLLNLIGVRACVSGTLTALGLGDLVKPLCGLLGDGTNALNTVTGLLNSALGPLASSVSLSTCPSADGAPPASTIAGGIATSTEVRTTVSWKESGSARTSKVVQNAIVRKVG